MTGVELYIRRLDGNFHVYKQRHDGYYIEDFLKEIGDEVFNLSSEEIVKRFHDKFFFEDSEHNFHENESPFCYGVIIDKEYIKHVYLNGISIDIDDYLYDNVNEYACGYCDYMVYIDLINKTIEGLDDEEDCDEDDICNCGCSCGCKCSCSDENQEIGDDGFVGDYYEHNYMSNCGCLINEQNEIVVNRVMEDKSKVYILSNFNEFGECIVNVYSKPEDAEEKAVDIIMDEFDGEFQPFPSDDPTIYKLWSNSEYLEEGFVIKVYDVK